MEHTEKKCVRCLDTKPIKDFYPAKDKKVGRLSHCRECSIKSVNEYIKTKQGLTTSIYCTQKFSSKKRGHLKPNYSLSELREWIFHQDIFHKLYDEWVESGYDKWKRPSCDRIDDYKPYSLDNLRVVSWMDNWTKSSDDRVNGVNKKGFKPVSQHSIDGNIIKVFSSATQAERETGILRPNIYKCCSGKRKYAGGFIWKYPT